MLPLQGGAGYLHGADQAGSQCPGPEGTLQADQGSKEEACRRVDDDPLEDRHDQDRARGAEADDQRQDPLRPGLRLLHRGDRPVRARFARRHDDRAGQAGVRRGPDRHRHRQGPGPSATPDAANTVSARVTAFNGPPNEGNPTILLHVRVDAFDYTSQCSPGCSRTPRAPYGDALIVRVPELALDSALTSLRVKFHKSFTFRGMRRSFVSARCSHDKHGWRYRGAFRYASDLPQSVSTTQACQVKG